MTVGTRPKVLVLAGGHGYEHEPFMDMFRENHDIDFAYGEPPSSNSWFRADRAGAFDAIVCYDMQGFAFRKPDPVELLQPPADYADGVVEMLERGQGMVFLHHAMSAWPAWPVWAEIVGSRWSYVPGELHGTMYPSSGYTPPETRHRIRVLAPDHPVCEGVSDFDIEDEIYLNPVLEESFTPLLQSDYPMTDEHFFSGEESTRGRMWSREGWNHPPGKGYMGWVKTAGNSPVVYLQSGHGPSAYANPSFRRLLANAIAWVASEPAHEWARANRQTLRRS